MSDSLPLRRVLICEDDPAMVRIFQFILRQQGVVNVMTTMRGETVLSMVERERPDLVLLDLMLPGKDGLTVLRELKGSSIGVMVPVIVISGKESQEQVNQAMIAGAVDYVIKPFEPTELGQRIRNFLESLDATASNQNPMGFPPSEPPTSETPLEGTGTY